MPFAYYCGVRDLRNILSAAGVNLRIDDTPPDILGDVLGMASDDVEERLWARYRLALQAGGNSWVRHRTAEIGAYYLAERRGNAVPSSIASRYQDCIKKLDAVHAGRLNVPQAADTVPLIPVLSQGRVRLGPLGPVFLVERQRSTGNSQGYVQHWDILELPDLFFWSITLLCLLNVGIFGTC